MTDFVGGHWAPSLGAQYAPDTKVLIVVRESSLSASHQLANLAASVLARHRNRKGVEELVEAGVRPLNNPSRYGGVSVAISAGRMALIERDNTWILYALTSAAKDDDASGNHFTNELASIVREIRPDVLATGPISRIVRHENHVSTLSRAFSEVRLIVECVERQINFASPSAGSDFVEIAAHAVRERALIMSRMDNGRLMGASRGFYTFPAATLPRGFAKRDKIIVLDDRKSVQAVREAFERLAQPSNSERDVARFLLNSGTLRARKALSTGDEEIVSLSSAESIVRRLIDAVDTYATGVHVVQFRHSSSRGGGDGALRFDYPLPAPKEGWFTPAVLDAVRERGKRAQARRHRLNITTANKHSRMLPLAGFRWRVGRTEFAILTRDRGRSGRAYLLAGRPAAPWASAAIEGEVAWEKSMQRGWPYLATSSSEFRCFVRCADLHESISRELGALDTFEFAELAALVNAKVSDRRGAAHRDRRQHLVKELEIQRRVLKRAKKEFFRLDDDAEPAEYEIFRAAFVDAEKSVKAIEASLASLRLELPTAVDESFTVDAAAFLGALARLRFASEGMPRAVVKALHEVLCGFTLTHDQRLNEVVWSVALRLPTQNGSGVRTTAPISGRVEAVSTPNSPAPAARRLHALNVARSEQTLDPATLALAVEALRERGLAGRGASQALLGAPMVTRQTLIDHLLDGLEPANRFSALVIDGYVTSGTSESRQQRVWNEPARLRQPILDEICRRGALSWEDLVALHPNAVRGLHALINDDCDTWQAIARQERTYIAASKDGGQRVHLYPRECPHCGGRVDIVARVRECPAGLLCSACMRMPTADSPEFPGAYRSLAARPQARREPRLELPKWWGELHRVHVAEPHLSVTVLGQRFDRTRAEIKDAARVMRLDIPLLSTIPSEWTDARLREAYLMQGRSLNDLAYDLGVSTGTLSKRIRQAGIWKYRRQRAS